MILTAVAALCVAAPPAGEAAVAVQLLARSAPAELLVEGGGRARVVAADGDALRVDGASVAQPLRLAEAAWSLRVPGEPARRYRGALALAARGGALEVTLRLPLERYVAQVVASESEPGTPPQALAALAVVARSFALGARPRHPGGALCDLAHCQVLRGAGVGEEAARAARDAARATSGQVLRLADGAIAEAVFHGACGGHTADPVEVFGSARSGAGAVDDPGCAGPAWRALVPPEVLLRVARERLRPVDAGGAPPRAPGDLVLRRGAGGWVVQVASRDGRQVAGGDAFARALDGALGHGRIRSDRFQLAEEPAGIVVRGTGLGHGVGLCQAGAAARAAAGAGYREILRHYFPRARLGKVAPAPPRGR